MNPEATCSKPEHACVGPGTTCYNDARYEEQRAEPRAMSETLMTMPISGLAPCKLGTHRCFQALSVYDRVPYCVQGHTPKRTANIPRSQRSNFFN
jgi:hypothetical protein